MTRDELIEKVARSLCMESGDKPDVRLDATIATDIVLEEAARIAQLWSVYEDDDADIIADKIRSLKSTEGCT